MGFSESDIPVFDATAIENLRKVAGDDEKAFILEMAQLFLDETTKSLAELEAASEKGDWKVVTRLAHSLKSSAATLGLMRLSSVCTALELETKGGASTPETAALRAAVLAEFETAIPIMKGLT